jgi:hypothetical protein
VDITDVTGAGRVKQTNPFNYGVGGTSAVVTPAGQALDTVVNDFVRTTQPTRMQTVGSRNLQQSMATGSQNALNLLLGQMYETSGGANQATIRQLEAQRLASQQNYKTNRADAQNLYGVLSQDIQEMGADLQTSYNTAIGESGALATKRQAELQAEQARQQANRERAAAELGIAPESILTSYASDEALNTGMGNVAASATNWENLLRGQQESAMERTNRLVTATGNTKTQTLLGMKAFLDAQQAQINAQIAGERGKTPTQKLTPLGKLLSGAMNDQTLKQAQAQFPDLFGSKEVQLTKGQQDAQDAMTQLGITPKEYSDLLATGTALLQENRAAELTNPQRIVLASTGLSQWMFGN